MKTLANTQLFILTDIAKSAIINHLTQRLNSIGKVHVNAITPELSSAAIAERNELIAQLDYYSGGPAKVPVNGPITGVVRTERGYEQCANASPDLKPQWVKDAEAKANFNARQFGGPNA